MDPYVAHGGTLSWGTYRLAVTSLQYSSQVNSEIDITSMASDVSQDPGNTQRKLVDQEFDTCFAGGGGGELNIDFFVYSTDLSIFNAVGHTKRIEMWVQPSTAAAPTFFFGFTAGLSQVQLGANTGEYVKGSAVFKLSKK